MKDEVRTCHKCGNTNYKIDSCTHKYIQIGEKIYERVTKPDQYNVEGGTCHDCNIIMKEGNIHHAGCDCEKCPRCGGQSIGCGCCWIFCDDGCGFWEENGCDEPHAGKPLKDIPTDKVLFKPTTQQIKLNMSLRTKNLLAGMEEYKIKSLLKQINHLERLNG